jgi:hypothetical protein
MKVTVIKNWTETDYIFAPEHKAEVIGFYTKEYWAGRIQWFKAVMDNGEIVAIGAMGQVSA